MGRKKREYTREQYEEAMRLLQQGLSPYKVAKMLGIPESTVYMWKKGGISPAARWKPRPTKELAYVLGALAGDGCVTAVTVRGEGRIRYRIILRVKDYEFAYEFSKCMATILNKPIIKRPKIVQGLWDVTYDHKAFYMWYKSIYGKYDRLREYVERDGETVRAFLRGIFNAEGSYYRHRRPHRRGYEERITLTNTDLTLIRYVQHLLLRYFSIPSRLTSYRPKRYRRWYTLVISRRASIRKFFEQIGFTIRRRQREQW